MPAHPVSRVLWAAYCFLWLGGVGSHIFGGGTPPNMAWAAPLYLALAAAIAVQSEWPNWKPLLLAASIGLLFEALGVATGYPFGPYAYTPVLAPALLGVPLVVAGAWMVLFLFVRQMRLGIVLSALAMASLDLIIDPLAANFLGFWKWKEGGPYYGVPLLNFAGWFGVGALIFALAPKTSMHNRQAVWLGVSILLFFAAIAALHGYLIPAGLGVTLSAASLLRQSAQPGISDLSLPSRPR